MEHLLSTARAILSLSSISILLASTGLTTSTSLWSVTLSSRRKVRIYPSAVHSSRLDIHLSNPLACLYLPIQNRQVFISTFLLSLIFFTTSNQKSQLTSTHRRLHRRRSIPPPTLPLRLHHPALRLRLRPPRRHNPARNLHTDRPPRLLRVDRPPSLARHLRVHGFAHHSSLQRERSVDRQHRAAAR